MNPKFIVIKTSIAPENEECILRFINVSQIVSINRGRTFDVPCYTIIRMSNGDEYYVKMDPHDFFTSYKFILK